MNEKILKMNMKKKEQKKAIKWGRRKIYIGRKRLMPVNENRVIGIAKTIKNSSVNI